MVIFVFRIFRIDIDTILKSDVHLNKLHIVLIVQTEAFHVDVLNDTLMKVLVLDKIVTCLEGNALYRRISHILGKELLEFNVLH